MMPNCYQLRRSWPVMQLGPHHWNICLRDRYQYRQSTQSALHRRHRLILVTSYHRFVILNPLTGADFLQLEHTALTGTVGLKPQTTTLHKWFRLESATVVSDIGVKARTSRLFSLFFGYLDKKLKVLDCAIKTT